MPIRNQLAQVIETTAEENKDDSSNNSSMVEEYKKLEISCVQVLEKIKKRKSNIKK